MVDGWRLFVPLWGQIAKFLVSGGQGPGARQVTTGPPPTLAPALTFTPTLTLAPTPARGTTLEPAPAECPRVVSDHQWMCMAGD